MSNYFNISQVPYTLELKKWLLDNGFVFFYVSNVGGDKVLTPFKNLVDLHSHSYLLKNKKFISKKTILEYDFFNGVLLDLSIEIIHSKSDRSYVHLN